MTADDAPTQPTLPPLTAQVERLIEREAHRPAGVEAQALRTAAERWGGARTDALVVLAPQAAPPSALTALLTPEDDPGAGMLDMVDIDETEPAEVDLPAGPVYLVEDPQQGSEIMNVTPDEALPALVTRERSPLLLTEGLHWALQQPTVLESGHSFMTIGSRLRRPGGFYNVRTPVLWSGADPEAPRASGSGAGNGGRATLGWCWWGSRHERLGIASASCRVPVPAV